MLKYRLMVDVVGKKITRVFPCENNTGAAVMHSYVGYLIDEGFDKKDIKNAITALFSTQGEPEEEISKRLDEGENAIRDLVSKNVLVGINPMSLDELYYLNRSGDELVIDDPECIVILLKAALDAIIDIKSIGGEIEINENKVSVHYNGTDSVKMELFKSLEPIIKEKNDIILTMQSFLEALRNEAPKKYIKGS